ncbi:MAG: Rrf2 family transcriptional regulator [Bacteroides sp.]|nr:Rrf2 family transcriptional regulator [Prevotella sp.]MCM1408904.1 Rrf2 family transcriptional regulator [Treponema brennaborense]MCM1470831.1 Rrf2 family transcriptional regulator [Bacteroides sp.]
MKITSRFTVAVHTLLAIHVFEQKRKTTSEFIASSVNVNPVVIRRTLQSLKAAGIIEVKAGSGGASIVKPLKKITLYDIYLAADCVEGSLFHFHDNPNPACPVGKNIHIVLEKHLDAAQTAMENTLKSVTLFDIANKLNKYIQQ